VLEKIDREREREREWAGCVACLFEHRSRAGDSPPFVCMSSSVECERRDF
jgi:hypothetical protein